MKKSNIQLHTKQYSTKLTCCQVYNYDSNDLRDVLSLVDGKLVKATFRQNVEFKKEPFYPLGNGTLRH